MRGSRPTTSDWFSISVVVIVGASVVLLRLSGRNEASSAVFATFLGLELLVAARSRAVRRRRGGQPGDGSTQTDRTEVLRFQEARKLAHPATRVWHLIQPPENEPLFSPSTARGYKVPGTPDGLGEQQAFVGLDGTTTVIEVVEYVADTRAVTVQVSPKPDQQFRMITNVEQHADGCLLTVGIEYSLSTGQTVLKDAEASARRWLNDYLDGVQQALGAHTFPRPV